MTKKKLTTRDIAYIALMAALIAVCAAISIPTSPPFTMQMFAIFVAVGLLGARRGTITVLVYLLIGAVGLPVFSSMTGGIGILLGQTGGYLIGFIFVAIIEGIATDKFRGNTIALFISMIIGTIVCYVFGTAWFMHIYIAANGEVALATVLGWCVIPFIIPDICKMLLAVVVIKRVAPLIKI